MLRSLKAYKYESEIKDKFGKPLDELIQIKVPEEVGNQTDVHEAQELQNRPVGRG